MAATTGGALKAMVESLGLGLSAYRDEAPQASTPRPYVTIIEEIALVPDPLEDAAPSTAVETAQVDLWQDWRNLSAGTLLEDYTLAPRLKRGLHGKRLASVGTSIVYIAMVRSSIRLLDPDGNIIHHALTVEVFREL